MSPRKGPSSAWPAWWQWELEVTPHVEQRMEDREFTELDLRAMLHRALGFQPDHMDGRFAIRTDHRGRPWHIIVEPDPEDRLLVVVTAYPLG